MQSVWKVEISYNTETGKMDVNYDPNSETVLCWMLRRAEHLVFNQEQEPAGALALSGITGFGKLTVERKDRKD